METVITFVFVLLSLVFGATEPTIEQLADPLVATSSAQVLRVIDGDTIIISIDDQEETVRYIGIDTPEPYRDGEPACFSAEATQFNRQLVDGEVITLVSDTENRDRYGRLLRYVYVDGVFVNEVLIAQGYATTLTIPPNTRFVDTFAALQSVAQESNLGLWLDCQDGKKG